MRSRDEVLIDRFLRNDTFTLEQSEDLRDAVKRMADRLRELEAQLVSNAYTLAASEPVAWAIVNRDGVTMDVRMTVTEAREHLIGGDTLRPLVFADHPTTPTRGSDE